MTLYVDRKFLNQISPRLSRFTAKSEFLWNFRCPICGDSSKNKLKARGYIYRRDDGLFFSCHNCGASMSLGNFIRTIDRNLYDQYKMETFVDKNGYQQQANEESGDDRLSSTKRDDLKSASPSERFNTRRSIGDAFELPSNSGLDREASSQRINLPSISQLHEDHIAKTFLKKRQIPNNFLTDLFWAEDFNVFLKEIAPNHELDDKYNDGRIIIPFYDRNKNLLGFQGRALVNSKIKYITIKLSIQNDKIFGLERLDTSKTVYVCEGPIDSLFVDNAIATMDPQLTRVIAALGDLDYIFVFDNEPRNPQICSFIEKTISMGKRVCIWPKSVTEKDINDMIIAGTSPSEVRYIIDNHTFEGLRAQLEFNIWKQV